MHACMSIEQHVCVTIGAVFEIHLLHSHPISAIVHPYSGTPLFFDPFKTKTPLRI